MTSTRVLRSMTVNTSDKMTNLHSKIKQFDLPSGFLGSQLLMKPSTIQRIVFVLHENMD